MARKLGSGEDLRTAIVFLRALHDWNQAQLAEAAGIDRAQISLYEAGKRTPSEKNLKRLIAAAELSLPFFKGLLAFIRSARLGHRQAEDQGLGVPKEVAQAVENAAVQILAAMPGYEPREPEPSTEDLRREAGEAWDRLKGFSSRDRRVLVAGAREYQTWALCERLCAESERAMPGNAARAVELAELALEVAALVPGEQSWRLRLQGYAWAHVGNARRVANDWPRAEEAFQHARALWRPWEEGDPALLDAGRALHPPLPAVEI